MHRNDPPVRLSYLKCGLEAEFIKREDLEKAWHIIQSLLQGEDQTVDAFLKQFKELWGRWCKALANEVPPSMLKKNRFIDSLKRELRLKVELKKPQTFEDAVKIAKEKK